MGAGIMLLIILLVLALLIGACFVPSALRSSRQRREAERETETDLRALREQVRSKWSVLSQEIFALGTSVSLQPQLQPLYNEAFLTFTAATSLLEGEIQPSNLKTLSGQLDTALENTSEIRRRMAIEP